MLSFDAKLTCAGAKTWLIKRGIGPFRKRRRELADSQWYTTEQLQAYQLARLRKLLFHAYATVPFYTKLFDAHCVRPDGIRSLADLSTLPILTKRALLSAAPALVSHRFHRWLIHTAHTGGTTGTPLSITRDIASIGNEHAFVRRQWEWAGLGLSDRCAYLTGRMIVPPDQTRGRLYRYDAAMKELILSTYHLGPHVTKQYLDAMLEHHVVALAAYPSAALTLARECLHLGMRVHLRAVLTSSETLSPEARKVISEAFSCPVFDFYGSAERVCYIHTCEHQTYHIVPEYGYTELLPVEGMHKAHRIIATGFWNLAMPLIRYDSGDLVQPSRRKCPCGRHFPVIEKILGRRSDRIVTPSGRELGAALLTHLLYGVDNILESQLVQDAPDHVYFDYVALPGFADADRATLRRLVAMHLPRELCVEFRNVDALPRTRSGKLHPIVSFLDDEGATTRA